MTSEWVTEMATFVVRFGFTPADYWALTLQERNAIIEAANEDAKRK